MKEKTKKYLLMGSLFIITFIIWTMIVMTIDVKPLGALNTDIGLATINTYIFQHIGFNMLIYTITDWLGLIPIAVCLFFGFIGFVQLIQRRSLLKVDHDLLVLGIYYILVIFFYLFFEMLPLNYRPILIEGRLEASYPSSTTLLVLSVMPTLIEESKRRLKNQNLQKVIVIITMVFSILMVVARLISGVHWISDIVGSILLSTGLFCIYRALILLWDKEKN